MGHSTWPHRWLFWLGVVPFPAFKVNAINRSVHHQSMGVLDAIVLKGSQSHSRRFKTQKKENPNRSLGSLVKCLYLHCHIHRRIPPPHPLTSFRRLQLHLDSCPVCSSDASSTVVFVAAPCNSWPGCRPLCSGYRRPHLNQDLPRTHPHLQ